MQQSHASARSDLPNLQETFRDTIREVVRQLGSLLPGEEIPPPLQLARLNGIESKQTEERAAFDVAKQIYERRRRRNRFFDDALFGEAAWDMMVDLYIHEHQDRLISVTSATLASCVPPTTALRWITVLEEQGMVSRTEDPADARRRYLHLTEKSKSMLTNYFLDVLKRD
ncbi:MarR family transcriptional regulator [Novosphingobium sp. BL-8H]|uniref:MarR family transcriptional regulator n=1 Tax=Novosphingobium sp. BL-8H TaxID=3127640 RepID=UPI00375745B6